MGLLALLMAGVAWVTLRKRASSVMTWVLTAALVGVGMATDLRQALADVLYTMVLGGGSTKFVSKSFVLSIRDDA